MGRQEATLHAGPHEQSTLLNFERAPYWQFFDDPAHGSLERRILQEISKQQRGASPWWQRSFTGMPGRWMYPRAVDLTSPEVQQYSDRELFWIVKNGIRLSGMPAFGRVESDEHIWNLVHYVRTLRANANPESGGVAHRELEQYRPP